MYESFVAAMALSPLEAVCAAMSKTATLRCPQARALLASSTPCLRAGYAGFRFASTSSHLRGSPLQQQRRPFSVVSNLTEQDDTTTHIVGQDKYGFNVNGIYMRGSILAFNNFTLLWNCQHVVAITPRNLAAVHMIRPKPEVLIIGTGDDPVNVNPGLYNYFSRKGIAVEVMTNTNAIATFNVLVSQERHACAALVSRTPVSRDDASLYLPNADLLVTEQDRQVMKALAEDVLPEDRDRLLTDGLGSGYQVASTASGPATASGSGASIDIGKRTFTVPSSASTSQVDTIKEGMKRTDAESIALSTRYGYPGAMPVDQSPVRPSFNAGTGAEGAGRSMGVTVGKQTTQEDLLGSIGSRNQRKSGLKPVKR